MRQAVRSLLPREGVEEHLEQGAPRGVRVKAPVDGVQQGVAGDAPSVTSRPSDHRQDHDRDVAEDRVEHGEGAHRGREREGERLEPDVLPLGRGEHIV